MKTVTVALTQVQLALIVEALDSHKYWQVSDESQRNDGFVYFEPDDDNAAELGEITALEEYLGTFKV